MSPAPFRIYNSLTKAIEPFVPIEEGRVRLYVCGMTVYDHIHVGHGRAMVVFDAFTRYLRYRGWNVNFVRNFTDVDDKIIKRAHERGLDPAELAQNYIAHFHHDTDQLGLMRPDQEPRVSTSIPDIINMIKTLIKKGNAYEHEGSVLFSVKSFDEYGKLSRQNVDELRSADEETGKRHAADFALWKAAKPNEPTWPSPWGPGRPGWHIECSAMSCSCLGDKIDIHGGGVDLVFPHHENEIAQTECATGKKFATYWMHNGMLTMTSGQKMGKSLGNVINIRDALKEYPAESIRFYLLQNHYRSALPWSGTALSEALSMLARLYDAKEQAVRMGGSEKAEQVAQSLGTDAQQVLDLGLSFKEKLLKVLDEDFNTAQSLALAFELARAINRFAAHKKAKKRGGPVVAAALEGFDVLTETLGILGADPKAFQAEVKEKRLEAMGLDAQAIETQIAARSQARDAKDWALSDSIRDELNERGIVLMDTPNGIEWKINL
ncbi:MAG: cysteine--tRNA ligase [Proteobacteria bacterium]|nr:cysteine--tRNA ligase [Pseudomonadota bacterium]